ncbi:MAG: hypothetical protein GY870_02970 [archaeon]|nr:hypothetical protein [archaeon]
MSEKVKKNFKEIFSEKKSRTRFLGLSIISIIVVSSVIIISLLLLGSNINQAPIINSSAPSVNPSISEGTSLEFSITASDPENDPLTYSWFQNGSSIDGNLTAYTFTTNYSSAGLYNILVNITDGENIVSKTWALSVSNVQYFSIIKDINIDPSEYSSQIGNLVNISNIFYFSATDHINGEELWRSDGTESGTYIVKDIYSGEFDSNPGDLTIVNNGTADILYFGATDRTSGSELWRSDGTESGTYIVKDINPGSGYSSPNDLTVMNNGTVDILYFGATDATSGYELWRSDGTESGTNIVKDIYSGTSNSYSDDLTRMNNGTEDILYFSAIDATSGYELWRSDGTESGTYRVKNINPDSGSSSPYSFTVMNNGTVDILYFNANNGTSGYELWRSDGAESGTYIVKDIRSGTSDSYPNSLTVMYNGTADILYFSATDATSGAELWRSDGTESGTYIVKDIRSGTSGIGPNYLTVMNNGTADILYFNTNNGTSGEELWRSDGTESGTYIVKDIRSGSSSSYPEDLTVMNNGTEDILYFSANNGTNGNELWRSDGTESGTYIVKDIHSGSSSSSPYSLTVINNGTDDILYFKATNGTSGTELFRSDGTESGTYIVKDICVTNGNNVITHHDNIEMMNDIVYFRGNNGTSGTELFRSDGTESGTYMVKDINSGSSGSSPDELTVMNNGTANILYFRANNGTSGNELWRSDGTESGTYIIKDINPGSGYSSPEFLIVGNNGTANILYFRANNGTSGNELWCSDGTESGTHIVKDIRSGSSTSSPIDLTVMNNGTKDILYFRANNGTSGEELWRSDGTESGTYIVKDIYSSSGYSSPESLIVGNNGTANILYFKATNGTCGEELWRSDGTESGTYIVKDIYLGSFSSSPYSLTVMNNGTEDILYFRATNGTSGTELFRSDGTESGTYIVKDIYSGTSGSGPNYLTVMNNGTADILYFSATNGTSGTELFRSDGTKSGTYIVKDIYSGISDSSPSNFYLTNIDGNEVIYFRADDGTFNNDVLWRTDGTEEGTIQVIDAGFSDQGNDHQALISTDNFLIYNAFHYLYGNELWILYP